MMADVTFRRTLAACLSACALAGCGSGSGTTAPARPTWTTAQCTREAHWILGHARQILRYYSHENGDIYPADVSFIMFRNAVGRFRQFGCPARIVGATLRRGLTAGQRTQLLQYISPQIADYIREALSA
jgi:hypothetical protein